LAQRVARIVAIELDSRMLRVLGDTLRDDTNVRLVQGDILKIDPVCEILKDAPPAKAAPIRYKVVANLPYYITSAVLRHLLGARIRPEQMTVMVQREVAERIVALPGKLSLLAISVQVYGQPEIVCHVPASAFYPTPKVDSAVLRIKVYEKPRVAEDDMERFFKVVRAGYAQKRKQLRNSLTHNLHLPRVRVLAALEKADISPDKRPQMLTIEAWSRLACALSSESPG
jgi:16S rRNA (adenine1518-N6/adenine1519-N6)-dimethyltransferase